MCELYLRSAWITNTIRAQKCQTDTDDPAMPTCIFDWTHIIFSYKIARAQTELMSQGFFHSDVDDTAPMSRECQYDVTYLASYNRKYGSCNDYPYNVMNCCNSI